MNLEDMSFDELINYPNMAVCVSRDPNYPGNTYCSIANSRGEDFRGSVCMHENQRMAVIGAIRKELAEK